MLTTTADNQRKRRISRRMSCCRVRKSRKHYHWAYITRHHNSFFFFVNQLSPFSFLYFVFCSLFAALFHHLCSIFFVLLDNALNYYSRDTTSFDYSKLCYITINTAIIPFITVCFGNPSSPHIYAKSCREAIVSK
jgi:hypothetical protein